MNIEQEIKQLKKEEQQENEPCLQQNHTNWIIPTIAVLFLIKYFATGRGFELGAFAGYWWLIFLLPMILGAFSDQSENADKGI